MPGQKRKARRPRSERENKRLELQRQIRRLKARCAGLAYPADRMLLEFEIAKREEELKRL